MYGHNSLYDFARGNELYGDSLISDWRNENNEFL